MTSLARWKIERHERSPSSYLMFAENGDQVGISDGLQGVWKLLVAGKSLEEETINYCFSHCQAQRLLGTAPFHLTLPSEKVTSLVSLNYKS